MTFRASSQPMPDQQYLHITGMGRSGTTLLEKLLCNHPHMSVLPQPFPFLYVQAKRDFLHSIGCDESSNPLSHYFLEPRYTIDDVSNFLTGHTQTPEKIRSLFHDMQDYSGQGYKPADLQQRVDENPGGLFLDTVKSLLYSLRHRESASVFGSKEIHTEEILPFLLAGGFKCLLIIRDPRDAIASFDFGSGDKYGGRHRPTLFYVRNWRKSVAVAMHLEHHENFLCLRYEDLVQQTSPVIQQVCGHLDVPFYEDFLAGELRDQQGNRWQANSSFDLRPGVSEKSIGRHRDVMPESMRRYIECTCAPEMRWVGYDVGRGENMERLLREFREPFSIERAEFPADYSHQESRITEELSRMELLGQTQISDEDLQFFFSKTVFEKLTSDSKCRCSLREQNETP